MSRAYLYVFNMILFPNRHQGRHRQNLSLLLFPNCKSFGQARLHSGKKKARTIPAIIPIRCDSHEIFFLGKRSGKIPPQTILPYKNATKNVIASSRLSLRKIPLKNKMQARKQYRWRLYEKSPYPISTPKSR